MRRKEETMVDDGDSEVEADEDIDEFADYFKDNTPPKLMITTNRRPSGKMFEFLKDLKAIIPNAYYYERKNFKIKDILKWASNKKFTNVIIFIEKGGVPHTMIMSHLPKGPTAHYRVSSVKPMSEIVNRSRMTEHQPEMIMNHFDTKLGHRTGRMLASMFPQVPEFEGRRVITFHNQRDFIFFRHHHYEFNEDGTRANL